MEDVAAHFVGGFEVLVQKGELLRVGDYGLELVGLAVDEGFVDVGDLELFFGKGISH